MTDPNVTLRESAKAHIQRKHDEGKAQRSAENRTALPMPWSAALTWLDDWHAMVDWSNPKWGPPGEQTYPLVTDQEFPGDGVMRCAECGRDLPVDYPFARKPDSVIGDTPTDLIVCVYCGPAGAP